MSQPKAQYLDTILAEEPLEDRKDFEEHGQSCLTLDEECLSRFDKIKRHGRMALQDLHVEASSG